MARLDGRLGRGVDCALGMLALISCLAWGDAHAAATWPSDFDEEVIASGLDNPTAMAFAPDGRIFVTEKAGTVRVIDANGLLLPAPFATVSVSTEDDLGLIGLTLDPDFANNHYVYLAYTTTIVPLNPLTVYSKIHRITRCTASGNVAVPEARSRSSITPTPTTRRTWAAPCGSGPTESCTRPPATARRTTSRIPFRSARSTLAR